MHEDRLDSDIKTGFVLLIPLIMETPAYPNGFEPRQTYRREKLTQRKATLIAATVIAVASIGPRASADLVVDYGGSQIINNFADAGGTVTVGWITTGTLTINALGHLVSESGYVGSATGSYGDATVRGKWVNSSDLLVGYNATGRLTVESGGYVSSRSGFIGHLPAGVGEAVVSGTWVNDQYITVGNYGDGSLTIEDGGFVSAPSRINVAINADSSGTLIIKSGTLATNRIYKGEGSGAISIDGGTLVALNTDNGNFISDIAEVTLAEGGVTIDTNELQIGIGASFSGSGGVTKTGGGSLTLSGLSSHSGGTVIRQGQLLVASNSSLGSGGVRVEGGELTVADSVTLSQTVELDGGILRQQISGSLAAAVKTSHTNGGLRTSTSILAGSLSGETTLTFSFYNPSGAENDGMRLSSAFSLEGTGSSVFVLQLALSEEANAERKLGWLDTETNLWTLAVAGNMGNNATGEMRNYQGSFFDFQGEYGGDLASYVGAFGYDHETGSVWAVLDHNSDFAVIPEPRTMALFGLGAGMGWLLLRKRRRDSRNDYV